MSRFYAVGLMTALALLAAGCGASGHPPAQHLIGPPLPVSSHAEAHYGPFVLSGGWTGGDGSGLWGDGGSGPTGTTLGCIDARHYSQAFGIENRSKRPVTLTSARGANPDPAIIDLVAIQLRLLPRARPSSTVDNGGGGTGIPLAYRGWSAAPTRPVTIPPGRAVAVQTNYLMHDCDELSGGRTVIVPGTVVLAYRSAGDAHRAAMPVPIDRIVLGAGPTRRQCAPVVGSASLVAADTGCAAARQAALACHPMSHSSFGTCTVAGVLWDCGRIAGPGSPLLESCWQPQLKSHWFSTVWIDKRLTVWGAFASARGRSLAGGGGSCSVGSRTLAYRGEPVQLGPGFGVARVELSVAPAIAVRATTARMRALRAAQQGSGSSSRAALPRARRAERTSRSRGASRSPGRSRPPAASCTQASAYEGGLSRSASTAVGAAGADHRGAPARRRPVRGGAGRIRGRSALRREGPLMFEQGARPTCRRARPGPRRSPPQGRSHPGREASGTPMDSPDP